MKISLKNQIQQLTLMVKHTPSSTPLGMNSFLEYLSQMEVKPKWDTHRNLQELILDDAINDLFKKHRKRILDLDKIHLFTYSLKRQLPLDKSYLWVYHLSIQVRGMLESTPISDEHVQDLSIVLDLMNSVCSGRVGLYDLFVFGRLFLIFSFVLKC